MSAVEPAAFAGQAESSALVFGGVRYYKLSLTSFPTTAFTFSCRVRNADGGPVFFYGQLDEGSTIGQNTTFLELTAGVQVRIAVQGDEIQFPTQTLTDGAWHHLAVRFSQIPGDQTASLSVFVDGSAGSPTARLAMASGSGASYALRPGNTLQLAARPHQPGADNWTEPSALTNGLLRDVRIWSSALSDAGIRDEATAPMLGNEDGTYVALPLDTAHFDFVGAQYLDLGPAKRNASWVDVPTVQASFGQVDRFTNFPLGSRTVQMWVRPVGGTSGALLSYGPVHSSDPSNDQGQPWRVMASDVANDGKWHHVSVVTDSASHQELFVDGISKGAMSTGGNPLQNQTLLLGAYLESEAEDQLFSGQLRDVRIWSVARSASQIAIDAHGATPIHDATLVAYWPLDPLDPGGMSRDASGNGHDLNLRFPRAMDGAPIPDSVSGYFASDTVIDGRPCHLIVSTLDSLVIAGSVGAGQPVGTRLVPLDKDLVISANGLTIFGKIHVPGQRIDIAANVLSSVAGSQPELSTDPLPPQPPASPVAGWGTTPGATATPRSAMNRLPKTAQEFRAGGGTITWLTTSLPPGAGNPDGSDLYAFLAGFWANSNGSTSPDGSGSFPPASVMASGLPGSAGVLPTQAGPDALIDGRASISLVVKQTKLSEKLKLTARGGPGQRGQSGQVGGNGDNASVVNRPNLGENQMSYAQPFPSYGGFGGDGGAGARGGRGGAGGVIEWALLSDPTNSQWFDADCSGGPPGADGSPGAAGRGGTGSLLLWPGNYNMQLPKSPDGMTGGLSGEPAVKGPDGVVRSVTPTPALLFRQKFYQQLLSSADDLAALAFDDCMIDSDPSLT